MVSKEQAKAKVDSLGTTIHGGVRTGRICSGEGSTKQTGQWFSITRDDEDATWRSGESANDGGNGTSQDFVSGASGSASKRGTVTEASNWCRGPGTQPPQERLWPRADEPVW